MSNFRRGPLGRVGAARKGVENMIARNCGGSLASARSRRLQSRRMAVSSLTGSRFAAERRTLRVLLECRVDRRFEGGVDTVNDPVGIGETARIWRESIVACP